jgi:hypothetical protein
MENKLILLSISYPACHWGARMERECFVGESFLAAVRDRYICVQVDRELFPEADFIYMAAALAIRKNGGWPNNMILTPDMDPVISVGYAGGEDMARLMNEVDALWKKSERDIRAHAAHTSHVIKIHLETAEKTPMELEPDLAKVRKTMDMKNGGFDAGSKFPMTGILEFLLTEGSDDGFLILTLDRMARGGMFDHVNGGFFRCAVDAAWEKPQFEKLLCDSALLASLYARAAMAFGNREYEYAARRTLEFIGRDLRHGEAGGFAASLPSEGEADWERYAWTYEEALSVTGRPEFLSSHAMTEGGNVINVVFGPNGLPGILAAGKNIIRRSGPELDPGSLAALHDARNGRAPSLAGEKVIAAWQGMAISAFLRGAVAFDDREYLAMAARGGEFALQRLGKAHYLLGGQPLGRANLEDGAYLAMAFWDLFEATGAGKWLKACRDMVDYSKQNFATGDGGYYLASPLEGLIARPRNFEDQPYPSAAALLARVDLRLSAALGQTHREADSVKTAVNLIWSLKGGGMLGGEAMSLHREVFSDPMEVIYSLRKDEENGLGWLAAGYQRRWGMIRIPLGAEGMNPALSFGRAPNDTSRVFVCYGGSCEAPANSPEELAEMIGRVERDERP